MEKEAQKAQEAQQAETIRQMQQQQAFDPNSLESTNLIRQAANGQRPQNQWQTSTETQATETVNTQSADNKITEPKRTYIPSPAGMVPQGFDMSALDKAMAEADKAEAEIQSILARRY